MSKIFLLILILAGITFWWHWQNTPDPVQKKKLLQKSLIGVLLIGSLLLVVTGRMHWLGAVVAGLLATIQRVLPYTIRYFPMLTQLYRKVGPRTRAQNVSTVTTRYIEMTLDHDTGTLSGKVLDGKFKNCQLSGLEKQELEALYNFYLEDDPDSARLLENYLSERFGNFAQGEESKAQADSVISNKMDVTEALQVLGLEGNPGKEEITNAYRKVMQQLHPDRGGNQYFAAKANQARKVLLNNVS